MPRNGQQHNILDDALKSSQNDAEECAEMYGGLADDEHRTPLPPARISTAAYRKALQRCPAIVNSRDHRLLFLHAAYHDARAAAVRLLRCWTDRIDLFGEDCAFRWIFPITGGGDGDAEAFPRDTVELSIGYPRLSPQRDASGRALIVFNQSVIERKSAYDRRVCSERAGIPSMLPWRMSR